MQPDVVRNFDSRFRQAAQICQYKLTPSAVQGTTRSVEHGSRIRTMEPLLDKKLRD